MISRDPLGYYQALGILSDASQTIVKAVYRARAMELHPDRNKATSATKQFQELQRAYDVLSDTKARAAYDAQGSTATATSTSSAQSAAESTRDSASAGRFEPIVCSRCATVSAQPRYRVFHSVIGYVVGATKRAHGGIVCSRCETIVALKATATTLAFGWWSIHGFFWSICSILTNLVGGQRFPEQDVRILAHQAMYFDSVGNRELARAIAGQAYSMAFMARPSSVQVEKRASEGEDGDPLASLRTNLITYLESFEGQAKELRIASRTWGPRFFSQFALVAVVVAALASWLVVDMQRTAARQKEQAERMAVIEQERLQREGLERAEAAKVAANQSAALAKLRRPLPPSGLYKTLHPGDSEGRPSLKITTASGDHFYVKLVDWDTGAPVMSVFVRGDEEIEVGVPAGVYRVNLASGTQWYGDKVRFGPDTNYSTIDSPTTFSVEGNQLLGHELKLINVVNGNLRRKPITATDF